jgi:hypothetical protein
MTQLGHTLYNLTEHYKGITRWDTLERKIIECNYGWNLIWNLGMKYSGLGQLLLEVDL